MPFVVSPSTSLRTGVSNHERIFHILSALEHHRPAAPPRLLLAFIISQTLDNGSEKEDRLELKPRKRRGAIYERGNSTGPKSLAV